MKLIEDHLESLRTGSAVRVAVPELSADVVLIPAASGDSLEKVLEDALSDVREKKAWAELAGKARDAWAQENPY